ncbi:hypothetical protein MSG28_003803 [Choristoneura fumiferana]|uniref:Uncharacterized protein n=1 Tax=Choristoneura fumiferana TaxID=7141 RepID=A0ACC0KG42_CHOFU|nr:hypothetical protein MSG28_003803 [Choristoneura fumiferana]
MNPIRNVTQHQVYSSLEPPDTRSAPPRLSASTYSLSTGGPRSDSALTSNGPRAVHEFPSRGDEASHRMRAGSEWPTRRPRVATSRRNTVYRWLERWQQEGALSNHGWINDHRDELTRIKMPAKSPDLNPIENLWGKMVQEWDGNQCRTKDALRRHALNVWESFRGRNTLIVVITTSKFRFNVDSSIYKRRMPFYIFQENGTLPQKINDEIITLENKGYQHLSYNTCFYTAGYITVPLNVEGEKPATPNLSILSFRIYLSSEYYSNMMILFITWTCTPETTYLQARHNPVPDEIREKIIEKRRLRRVWHTSRHPSDKRALNSAIKELKDMIHQAANDTAEAQIKALTATKATDYSLWKVCKSVKKPIASKPPLRASEYTWARTPEEKANLFARHLSKIFTPNEPDPGSDETDIDEALNQDLQIDFPIQPTSPNEVKRIINHLENKKAPGFDLIDKKVLIELPRKATVYLTCLFNGIMRTGHFPALWKVSQIIMVLKPGKPAHDVSSYRPISLLPVISKIFEKILLKRLMKPLFSHSIIPDHQFGLRKDHATIEQIHRVCKIARTSLEKKILFSCFPRYKAGL